MQPTGYSPYREKTGRPRRLLPLPKLEVGLKKWILIVVGVFFCLFLILYLSLGELRFFANHFLRLGFFHKNYLILLQNDYELRPTGGFVTGFGEMSVTMGIPSGLTFHNSYEIDTENYIKPPYPHEELLKNEWYEGYTFRDANWNANFPEAAKELIQFYQAQYPEKDVDGMVVMNFSVIEDLIGALGGLEVADKELTKENLFKVLTDSVNDIDRHNIEALATRKDILGEIAPPLMSAAKWHPFTTKAVFTEALNSKDMFLWFRSEGLQKKVEKKGWANHLSLPENSDFLAVNIANLGSKKADRYLIKEVHQHINLKNEVPEITSTITLRFPGEVNMYAADYQGYLRLYIPQGAEVLSESKDIRVDSEGDFKVIGEKFYFPAATEKTFTYKYQLPRSTLNNGEYELRLIRQSGDDKRYMITVESSEDSGLESNDFVVRENKGIWEGILATDMDLKVKLLPDTTGPYPIEQVFNDLKTISIYWNEAISDASGGDALNYEVVDMNEINPEVTDEIKVVYAEVIDRKTTKLEVEGVTRQDLERYKIRLKDLKDLSNNSTTPNPKEITAVQRIPGLTSKQKMPAETPKNTSEEDE